MGENPQVYFYLDSILREGTAIYRNEVAQLFLLDAVHRFIPGNNNNNNAVKENSSQAYSSYSKFVKDMEQFLYLHFYF